MGMGTDWDWRIRMSKSCVIGSQGLVGRALMSQLKDAQGGSHNPEGDDEFVDITQRHTIGLFLDKFRPAYVYLPAYLTHVDGCEDTKKSIPMNINGVDNVVTECANRNIKLIFFSSSYVFDGCDDAPYKEDHKPFPINYYGSQKLLNEKNIVQLEKYAVIRTIGVFGIDTKCFVFQVLHNIMASRKVYVPSDQKMNPIFSPDLAKISILLAEKMENGVYNVAGDRCITKYEWAYQIASQYGLQNRIIGVETSEMKQIAKRPLNACLDCTKINSLGIKTPSLDDGLATYFFGE